MQKSFSDCKVASNFCQHLGCFDRIDSRISKAAYREWEKEMKKEKGNLSVWVSADVYVQENQSLQAF